MIAQRFLCSLVSYILVIRENKVGRGDWRFSKNKHKLLNYISNWISDSGSGKIFRIFSKIRRGSKKSTNKIHFSKKDSKVCVNCLIKNEADFDFQMMPLLCWDVRPRIMIWVMGHLIAAWKSCFVFLCICCKFFVYKSWFVVMVV